MINIINPYGIDNGETIDSLVIKRMEERRDLSSFPVRRVSDNHEVTISIDGRERTYRVSRTETQEPIRKNDELVLATYATEQFIILKPFAFRHRNSQIYFRL